MNISENLFELIKVAENYYAILFTIIAVTIIIKVYLMSSLSFSYFKSKKIQKPLFFLIFILIGSLIEDIVWLLKVSEMLFHVSASYRFVVFVLRLAWAFDVIQYQSIIFFMESLIEQKFHLTFRRTLFLLMNGALCSIFLYLAFFKSYYAHDISSRPPYEFSTINFTTFYTCLSILPTLIICLFRLRNHNIPKILKMHFKILTFGFICPRVISDFIQAYQFFNFPRLFTKTSTLVAISNLLNTFAIFYCAKKIMRLRFLNLKSYVQSKKKYDFIDKFKYVLERLSQTSNIKEIIHISKTFFKEAINIPTKNTTVQFRSLNPNKYNQDNKDFYESGSFISNRLFDNVEGFITDSNTSEFLKDSKILIYDDIEFSNFYEDNESIKESLKFLQKVNADIFIPIYKKTTIIAYIIIERNEHNKQLYSNVERDEIVVFASYLANIIDLLQNKNLEMLIAKEKELKDELYLKHQEINKYKESIRFFLKQNQQKKIGVLFYKNRKFVFGNKEATELIPININMLKGHSLTQSLKYISKHVMAYKSTQISYTNDHQGNKIVLMGIPNLENNNVIILVYYPDISDTIKEQIENLNNPSEWDYLLYLETTKSGQLINQLIPGSGEVLLNIKIRLLKIALDNRATLLEMPEEDLMSAVEIIHHISLRENLHVIKLHNHTNAEMTNKLFGINPIFDKNEFSNQSLLYKLDGNGTLFIENVHFLDIHTQESLANFIRNGFFFIPKTDQKIFSNVRIICSTNKNLKNLIQQGKFSQALYDELKNNLVMPSVFTLPESELLNLANKYSEQAIRANDLKNLLELSQREKNNLINKHPASLKEFKEKIQQILIEKSKKNNLETEILIDPSFTMTDPNLIEAARLGKHALKDPKILSFLWQKFKNQNKIATFLGVNRSSVNRRFKEYHIE